MWAIEVNLNQKSINICLLDEHITSNVDCLDKGKVIEWHLVGYGERDWVETIAKVWRKKLDDL